METVTLPFADWYVNRSVSVVNSLQLCCASVSDPLSFSLQNFQPEPRKDHAVVMARYAHEISIKFIEVANDLELVLGYVSCYLESLRHL